MHLSNSSKPDSDGALRGFSSKRAPRLLPLLISAGFVPPVSATNELNIIGFSAESDGMAGADVAVARDNAALNINPAGLTQIGDGRLDSTLFGALHSMSATRTGSVPTPRSTTALSRALTSVTRSI